MLLKFGVTILLTEKLNSEMNEYASDILRLFVSHSIRIYGKEFCVYNVHSIIHLADDAKIFGTLNDVNCFPFENFLGFLKKSLRKSNQCLEQIVNRISEGRELNSPYMKDKICCVGKAIGYENNRAVFKSFFYKGFNLSSSSGDNCVFLNQNRIIIIRRIYVETLNENEIIYLEGKSLNIIKPFFNYPAESSIISLYEVSITEELITVSSENIVYKGILLPINNTYLCCPFVHSL